MKEFAGECFHDSCANLVCKMLEVSMLQSLELFNSVETPSFSTESVENNPAAVDPTKRIRSIPTLSTVNRHTPSNI